MDSKLDDNKTLTTVERTSDRDLVVTRRVDGPARLVFDAWTRPDLMMRWWVPKSFPITFLSCDMDARTGGTYRLTFCHPSSDQPIAFFGTYTEVIPNARLVWTNDESPDGAVSTVTFTEQDGQTQVVLHERYPTKQALDDAIASGSTSGYPEQYLQLDALLNSPNTTTA